MNNAGVHPRTPASRSRTTRLALCVSLVILAIATPALSRGAAANTAEYRVYFAQAETFGLSHASDVDDTTAEKGQAVRISRGGEISRTATTPSGDRLVVRAKANTCGTSPRMRVKIGGTIVGTVPVSAKSWTDYNLNVGLNGGSTVVRVSFPDDHVTRSGCTRWLGVDKTTLYSHVPANQGIAGSVCQPSDAGIGYKKPPTPYSTTALGNAPSYYETAPPSDRSTSVAPKGLVILIHGGGWFITGRGAAAMMRGPAEMWRAHGWSVMNVTSSRACKHWVPDMLWFYDRAEAVWPGLPICLQGHSAGGHVALMVAASRPDVRCVISFGGPTDLVGVGTERAYDPNSSAGQNAYPSWVRQLAIAAYGSGGLEQNSPLYYADKITCPVLQGVAEHDMLIPQRQVTDMGNALNAVHPNTRHEVRILAPGNTPWIHATVSASAADEAWRLAFELADGSRTSTPSSLAGGFGGSAPLL